MTIITRTNGQPYATRGAAEQQLSAMYMRNTHEVVPHEGGYALAPINRDDDPITLQPGDYVSTEGMTEDQYHAVARALLAAGFKWYGADNKHKIWEVIAIDGVGDIIGANYQDWELSRHLTIDQVLGATNAGTTTTQTEEITMTTDPITTLKKARQARDEAEKAYQEALGEAREYLGEGFRLLEKAASGEPGEDMTDPANWREGDVMEVADKVKDTHGFSNGELVTILNASTINMGKLAPRCSSENGADWWVLADNLRFHHRPA